MCLEKPQVLVDLTRHFGEQITAGGVTELVRLLYRLPGAGCIGPDLVGHCVNTLPIRSLPRGEATFGEYLLELREKVLDAFDHGSFTYGALLPRLKLRRDASRAPLISVLFNLDPQARAVRFGDLEARLSFNPKRFENFDLFVNAVERGDELTFELSYNTDLFARANVPSKAKPPRVPARSANSSARPRTSSTTC